MARHQLALRKRIRNISHRTFLDLDDVFDEETRVEDTGSSGSFLPEEVDTSALEPWQRRNQVNGFSNGCAC